MRTAAHPALGYCPPLATRRNSRSGWSGSSRRIALADAAIACRGALRSAVGGRSVVAIFVFSRLAIWTVAVYTLLASEPSPRRGRGLALLTEVWSRWDSGWFLTIARHGYHGSAQSSAFYPLYPALVGLLGRLLIGHYVIAGILISLIACAAAFRLLYDLTEPRFGAETARRAVLYLAVAPMSLFLQAVYSESLYLLLALGVFVLAERGRYSTAGMVAGLALLTRPSGVVLFPVLAVLVWSSTRSLRRVAWATSGSLLFLVYPLVLWSQTGHAWRFLSVEKDWQRTALSPLGPLKGLWKGTVAAWNGVRQLAGQVPHPALATDPTRIATLNLEYFAFLLVFIALAFLSWRRLGAAYGLFAALSLSAPLSAPGIYYPLLSLPRFGLVIFPFYVVLAQLGERRSVDRWIVATSALLLGAMTVQWALGQWVS